MSGRYHGRDIRGPGIALHAVREQGGFETAELRAKNRIDITMDFWRKNVDGILEFNDKNVLQGSGSVSNALMEEKVRAIYSEFDTKRKAFDAQQADALELEELKQLESKIKSQH